jgi:acyl CoA:acetate/3-ketoacid CoA transferase alpha subunit
MDKTFADAKSALHDLADGMTLLSGGFGLCGNPENCIRAIFEKGTKQLTIVSNNCGVDGKGLGILLGAGQVRKMISSYVWKSWSRSASSIRIRSTRPASTCSASSRARLTKNPSSSAR